MIALEIQEKLGPTLSYVANTLTGPQRVRVSAAMGAEVRTLIVFHLTQLGNTRHGTAERLGASPTGFIANLAENFDQSSTVSVDQDGVSISMRHPTLVRAVRDVTILPKKQFLTIPMNALAYGRRCGEFAEVQFVHRGEEIRQDIAAYLLVRSVTQKRDPSLLPTMANIYTAAARGAGREIKAVLQEAKRLS